MQKALIILKKQTSFSFINYSIWDKYSTISFVDIYPGLKIVLDAVTYGTLKMIYNLFYLRYIFPN